jgi:Tfx family DNA-binding protein
MIESRARRKLQRARETLKAYESIVSNHSVRIEKGTRLQEIPSKVLGEGDRFGIHLRSNIIEIIRMVKKIDSRCTRRGETTKDLVFSFTQSGVLSLA